MNQDNQATPNPFLLAEQSAPPVVVDLEFAVSRGTIGDARRSHYTRRVQYQRCGGGRRILKKRIGGE